MNGFGAVVRYEYRMAAQRWGVWLALAIAGGMMISGRLDVLTAESPVRASEIAGTVALLGNYLMPIVAGIVTADRLPRDGRLRTEELLWSTPLSRWGYVLGKFVGVVLALLVPTFLLVVGGAVLFVANGAPASVLWRVLPAFLAITVPAYLFIGAFSIVCPAWLPVRVYQVLFTGYWFWANYVSPRFVPTVNGTVLMPNGEFAANAFFGVGSLVYAEPHTVPQTLLNWLALALCAAAALYGLERYLACQHRRA